MLNHIINQIIIVVGQYRQFGSKEYERQFESLMHQLQKVTGLDWDGAVAYLENAVEGERAA
ncbi:hypothetical protein [Lederbergia lenta]|uniref:hypothetical protein n=1 Tax=Lederbergia lenta TaxID=1467 RepID=UPI002041DFA7|nr:hypothetical protein [Lederbergia lenta]MCM3110650.1 hypothetical protein [Lederbergia lenta]